MEHPLLFSYSHSNKDTPTNKETNKQTNTPTHSLTHFLFLALFTTFSHVAYNTKHLLNKFEPIRKSFFFSSFSFCVIESSTQKISPFFTFSTFLEFHILATIYELIESLVDIAFIKINLIASHITFPHHPSIYPLYFLLKCHFRMCLDVEMSFFQNIREPILFGTMRLMQHVSS